MAPHNIESGALRALLWSSPVGIGIARERVIYDANDALCTLIGYSREELIGLNVRILYESEEEFRRIGEIKYASTGVGGWAEVETRWITKSGDILDIQVSSAFLDPKEPERGIAFMAQDITERKRTEREFLIQNARWYELFANAPEGIVLLDTDFRYIISNAEFIRMFGFDDEELRSGTVYPLLVPKDRTDEADRALEKLRRGEVVRYESTVRLRRDGRPLPVSVLSKPIRMDDSSIGIYSIYRDISERVAAEENLRQSLRQKEVLLKEVHHRVKNNLNIISSLLSLQQAEYESGSIETPLETARSRVQSMAMIHDLLYQSTNLDSVPFGSYLRDLVGYLRSAFAEVSTRVRFDLDLEEVGLDIDTAIPCGLLLNEILVNSLKHAFPDGREGTVSVSLHEDGDDYVIQAGDDGVGIPESVDFESARSVGLELIRGLSTQAGAQLRKERGAGTRFTIRIPRKKRSE
ncbi:MAG: sensor histidine kinase [Spirochaetota bacterium]